MKIWATRFHPRQDLKASLREFVARHEIQAGFILTAVGSLENPHLRLAGESESQLFPGRYEIVSLVGTLSVNGMHLHISLADNRGQTIGGHLVDRCAIYTTAEIVIGESENYSFHRTLDPNTGFKELDVRSKK